MKVTEIRIDRTKSLGNYENIKLGLSAVVEEYDNPIDAIEKLKLILDWELNKEERDAQYEKFKAKLSSGEATDSIQKWVDKYEAYQLRVTGVVF
jgi:hypothetical protein